MAKSKTDTPEALEQKEPTLYVREIISEDVSKILIPEGMIYLVNAHGNGAGHIPVFIPNKEG